MDKHKNLKRKHKIKKFYSNNDLKSKVGPTKVQRSTNFVKLKTVKREGHSQVFFKHRDEPQRDEKISRYYIYQTVTSLSRVGGHRERERAENERTHII